MEFTNNKYCVYINKNDLFPDRVMSIKGYTMIQLLITQSNNNLKTLNTNIGIALNNKIFNCKYISK